MELVSALGHPRVTRVLRGAQTPMYHNNRMKMLYIAWYGSPERGLASEHEHEHEHGGGCRGRRRNTRTSRSTTAVKHPTTTRGPSARSLPPKVEAINSFHLVTGSSSRQWAGTLHLYGCAAMLCHVKYLKVGRSSLSCYFFLLTHFSSEYILGQTSWRAGTACVRQHEQADQETAAAWAVCRSSC